MSIRVGHFERAREVEGHAHRTNQDGPISGQVECERIPRRTSIAHSDHGYPENVGIAFGLRETTEYIIQLEEGTEPHCNSNGSFSAGHHCTVMLSSTRTVGIGIVRDGERIAMTMMFGDENGDSGW